MFENDGCTLFPDGAWVACCDVHDEAFAAGLTVAEFIKANTELFGCMAQYNWLAASIAFLGVMTGGGLFYFLGRKRPPGPLPSVIIANPSTASLSRGLFSASEIKLEARSELARGSGARLVHSLDALRRLVFWPRNRIAAVPRRVPARSGRLCSAVPHLRRRRIRDAPARAKEPVMKRNTKGLIAGSVALTALATSSISYYEGRSLRAYQDIVNVWTICDGETKGVKPGDVATPAQCDAMLAKNLVTYEAGLDRCLVAPVPGVVKVQFLSWAYNVGVGAACGSTLVRKANAGDVRGACNELLKWDRAGGQQVRGLTIRRQAENKACLGALS